jgi:hypothetical protein
MTREHSDVGGICVSNTSAVASGDYYGIQVLSEAVISAITFAADYSLTNLTTQTLPAGLYLPMRFSTLTLTSGVVVCLRAS